VLGTDGGIVASRKLECSCGVGGRAEDVLNLRRLPEGVEERSPGGRNCRAGGFARRRLSMIARRLRGPHRASGTVAQHFAPLRAVGERTSRLEGRTRAGIVRVGTLKDLQRRPSGLDRETSDLTKLA
jgi:hypothetical protein